MFTFNKLKYYYLFAIIISLLIINIISVRNDHGWGDFAQYITQAKSLHDGTINKMLDDSTYRYEKTDLAFLGPKLYPWGFPILLVPIYHFFGLNIVIMKLYTSIFFLISLFVIHQIFKYKLNNTRNFALVAIIAYSPFFFYFKEKILSEIPFLLFSLISIYLIQQIVIRQKYYINEIMSYVIIGIFIFISYNIRSVGILLLPCLFLAQIVEYDKSNIKIHSIAKGLIPWIVFIISQFLIDTVLPEDTDSYAKMFQQFYFEVIPNNIVYYSKIFSDFYPNYPILPSLGEYINIIALLLFLLGLIEYSKKDYLYVSYIILTLCLYIVFPAIQGLRYFIPIIPFYVYFIIRGINLVGHKLSINNIIINIVLFAVVLFNVLFILFNMYSQYSMKNYIVDGPYEKESIELFNYISSNTDRNSIIVFFKPRAMTLYTDRKSAAIADFNKMNKSGADYIVCNTHTTDQVWQIPKETEVIKYSTKVHKIFSNKKYNLYKILK
jgi:hypothetical protein